MSIFSNAAKAAADKISQAAKAAADLAARLYADAVFLSSKWVPEIITTMAPGLFARIGLSVLAGATARQGALISLAQLNALNQKQVRALASAAVGALRGEVIRGYAHLEWFSSLSMLSSAQVSELTSTQFAKFTEIQIQTLYAAGLTSIQLTYKDANGQFALQVLLTKQVGMLSAPVCAEFTYAQLTSRDANGQMVLMGLSGKGLTGEQLHFKDATDKLLIQKLKGIQFFNLSAKVVQTCTVTDFGLIAADGKTIFENFFANNIAQIRGDVVSRMPIKILRLTDASGNQGLQDLGTDGVGGLTQAQMAELSTSEIQTLNAGGFTVEQLDYVTASGTTVFDSLSKSNIPNLSTDVIPALPHNKLAKILDFLSPKQAAVVILTQIVELTPVEFAQFSGAALASLSVPAVAAIIAAQIRMVSPLKFKSFIAANRGMFLTAEAGSGISGAQIVSLNGLEFTKFSLDAYSNMPQEALAAVSGDQASRLILGQLLAFENNFKYLSASALLGLSSRTWQNLPKTLIHSIPIKTLQQIEKEIASPSSSSNLSVSASHSLIVRLSVEQVLGVQWLPRLLSANEVIDLIKNLNASQNKLKTSAILKVINSIAPDIYQKTLKMLVADDKAYRELDIGLQFHIASESGFQDLMAPQFDRMNKALSSAVNKKFTLPIVMMTNDLNKIKYPKTPSEKEVKDIVVELKNNVEAFTSYYSTNAKLDDKISQFGLQYFTFWKQSLTFGVNLLREYLGKNSTNESFAPDPDLDKKVKDLETQLKQLDSYATLVAAGRVISLLGTLTGALLAIMTISINSKSFDDKKLTNIVGLIANGMLPAFQSLAQLSVVGWGDTAIGKAFAIDSLLKTKPLKSSSYSFTSSNFRFKSVNGIANGTSETAVIGPKLKAAYIASGMALAVNAYNLGVGVWGLINERDKDGLTTALNTFGVIGTTMILASNIIDTCLGSVNLANTTNVNMARSQISKALNMVGCLIITAINLVKLGVALHSVRNDGSIGPETKKLLEAYLGTMLAVNVTELVVAATVPQVSPAVSGVCSIFGVIFTELVNACASLTNFDDLVAGLRSSQGDLFIQLRDSGYYQEALLSNYLSHNNLVLPSNVTLTGLAWVVHSFRHYSLFSGLNNWFNTTGNGDGVFNASHLDMRNVPERLINRFAFYTDKDGNYDFDRPARVILGYLNSHINYLLERQRVQYMIFFKELRSLINEKEKTSTAFVYSDNYLASANVNVLADSDFRDLILSGVTADVRGRMESLTNSTIQNQNVRMTYAWNPKSDGGINVLNKQEMERFKGEVVCYVYSQPKFKLDINNDAFGILAAFQHSSAPDDEITTDEVFIGTEKFSSDNVTYIIGATSVAVIVDVKIKASRQIFFIDPSFDAMYVRSIYATWSAFYRSTFSPSIKENSIKFIINEFFDETVPNFGSHNLKLNTWRNINVLRGGFIGRANEVALSITNLYNIGYIYGAEKNSANFSVLVGARSVKQTQVEQLFACNNNTLILAGNNSIMYAQNGGTLIGSEASSNLYIIQGGNADVYAFENRELESNKKYDLVSFQSYLSLSPKLKIILKDNKINGKLNDYRNDLLKSTTYEFNDNEAAVVRANYYVEVDGVRTSHGFIYNATTYKLGDCNADIKLNSDYTSILFQDNRGGLSASDSYSRDIELNGNGSYLSLGYGKNKISLQGYESHVMFSNTLVDQNGKVNNSTATNSTYELTYNRNLDDVRQLGYNSSLATLDLSGATGKVIIDHKTAKNTTLKIILDAEDNPNYNSATSISLKEGVDTYYEIHDDFDKKQAVFNIDLDPRANGYYNIFNIYSDLSNLAVSSIVAKNATNNGFDIFVEDNHFAHVNFIDRNGYALPASGVTYSTEENSGKVLFYMQGFDATSKTITTGAVSLNF